MLQRMNSLVTNNRRFIPIAATALLAVVAYALGALNFEGMQNPQVFLNMFRNSSYYLISAVGMTFVILTGGIDLSVSGILVLTTVICAAMLRDGANPVGVIALVLTIGMVMGAIMGSFIVYLKVQPFIATLAGMWFAKGMCFFISDNAINIDNRTFKILGQTKILIPGLKELADQQGTPPPYVSISVVVAFTLLLIGIYVAHYTRFGRTVYAIGGNKQSARLMGLPVNRTLMLVYTFNGFCSAMAGIGYALFVSSGHGLYAPGFELEVIASVVMGGTSLAGGSGYLIGTLFGVMVLAITQALIQFIGSLSSWWTRIVIGVLMLMFIGVQALVANRKTGGQVGDAAGARRRRQRLALGAGGAVVLIALTIALGPKLSGTPAVGTSAAEQCEVKPFRTDEAAGLVEDGAVIAYHRLAGPQCIDEIYAIYPDGRITADNGVAQLEREVPAAEVAQLLATVTETYQWFGAEIRDSYHVPCRQCFAHYVLVSANGNQKGVTAADGGVSMPPGYGFTLAVIRPLLPEFSVGP